MVTHTPVTPISSFFLHTVYYHVIYPLHPLVSGDTTPPSISNCPDNQMGVLPRGALGSPVFWQEPTASDDSGVQPTLFQTHRPGDIFLPGDTNVIYSFSDGSANTVSCRFTVTLSDGSVQYDTTNTTNTTNLKIFVLLNRLCY